MNIQNFLINNLKFQVGIEDLHIQNAIWSIKIHE